MKTVRMLSTGAYLPGVLEGIQVKTRHWMIDPATGDHRESNTDMAYKATRQALDRAGIDPQQVDLLVLSTASPDYPLPPEVTYVQEKLGLERCASVEIRSGCAGAVEALDLARMYLERGTYRTAVVIGSEAISPLLVPVFRGKTPDQVRMRDKMTVYNFGDGAGAMVLQASDDGAAPGIMGVAIACVGGTRKAGMKIVGAGTHAPIHKQMEAKRMVDLQVDVVESGRFTPYVLTEALRDVLEQSGATAASIAACIIPEGNAGYMTDELKEAGLLTPEWVALEDKIRENLELVGATGSAAVPIALDHVWKTGQIKQGDRVMLLAIETSKWKYAGAVLNWTAGPCPS
jgi:3-oxoacyl-[acyl-carrier-protein] synthase III